MTRKRCNVCDGDGAWLRATDGTTATFGWSRVSDDSTGPWVVVPCPLGCK